MAQSALLSTYVKINDKISEIPLHPERQAILAKTLSALGLSQNNAAVYPPTQVQGSGPFIEKLDPTTGKALASVQHATWQQVDSLLQKSQEAQKKWSKISADKRVDIIIEMCEEMRKHNQALADLETFEIGKIPSESNGELIEIYDVEEVIKKRRSELGGSEPYYTRVYDSSDPKRRELGWKGEERHLPQGILGKMTAFNFPYAVFGWGALPALATGNSVILKPHPEASLTSLALSKIMSDVATKHGFEGLISIAVLSDWKDTAAMWEDRRISIWEVTGSEAMGKAFSAAVAPSFRRTVLELGGNNAVIINKDANINNAVESTTFGSSGTAGQRCTSTRNVFVHADIYDTFVGNLVEAYKTKLRIGDPFVAGVNVGPVHHTRQVELFKKGIEHYTKAGSKILVGGNVLAGNFVEPTILEAPELRYDATLEEFFVPLVHVTKFTEAQVDDLVNEINRSGYGLSCGVFTASDAFFKKMVENIRVGILNRNYGSSGAEAGENFGGEGRTGGGRQLGPQMFTTYTRYVNSIVSPVDSKVVHAQGVSLEH
eukprot:TRINITY_DN2683_c0_g1_i1.p1 TRINITY_DN2683_c0_g1~~TRINITY_DN2683_c0_g1_i1.p1  ORF type:complete len:568 (-),score=306.90 TRINITY_DN2683_c0_g1_i1:90-1724(-)